MLSNDITDRQIKLVRGVHSGNKIRVQDADMRELSMGMVSNGYITDVPMVAAELNDIIKSKDIKEKDAIVSITSSSIVYKELLLDKPKSMKNPAIIEAMIQSDMNVSNEYNISFTIAGETEDEEKNKKIKVIATACPQRLVDGYVRLFSHIGLSLKAVNISNNSVTRLITNTPKMADRMPMLLIQIDKQFLNMNLYEDNQIVFSRYFAIDPTEYDNAPDYVTRAVYDNLFRMIQFIKSRKGAKPLKEIMFYGDIDNFIELSNAISSFNVNTNVLATPTTVITMTEIDFTKYANAIGAIYRRNKELEHINLLEATSAKESKGMSGFLLALGGACVGAIAVVAGVCIGFDAINSSYQKQITEIQTKLEDTALKNDLAIVGTRSDMLSGFENYNASMSQTTNLFNYTPKVTSDIINKVKEPYMTEGADNILDKSKNQELEVSELTIGDYSISAKFIGRCVGDPSEVPSAYAKYITENIKTKDGDPFFVNVKYTGFEKSNADDWINYVALATDGKTTYDTIFTFEITMNMQAGADEANATAINLSPESTEAVEEVTE